MNKSWFDPRSVNNEAAFQTDKLLELPVEQKLEGGKRREKLKHVGTRDHVSQGLTKMDHKLMQQKLSF